MFQFDRVFGKESTGFALRASYSSDKNTLDMGQFHRSLMRRDNLAKLVFAFTEDNNYQKNFNIAYLPDSSTATLARFSFLLGNYLAGINLAG